MLLALASLLGLFLLVDRAPRIPPPLVPLVGLGSVISLLYAAALAGLLRPAATLLFFGGLLAAAGIPALAWREGRRLPRLLASPAGAWVVAVGIFFAFATAGAAPTLWDDYSHWDLARRELLRTHALWDRSSAVASQDYPPGAALFQYFAGLWTGGTESGALAAHDWLILFPVASLLGGLGWRQAPRITALVAVAWLSLDLLGLGYQTLLVDHLLSAWLAALVVAVLTARQAGAPLLPLAPAFAALAIFKGTGLWFASIPLAVAAVDGVVLARAGGAPLARRRALAAGAVLAAAPLAAGLGWSARVRALELRTELTAPVRLADVVSDLGAHPREGARATRAAAWTTLRDGSASRIRPGSILWDRWTVGPGLARTVPMSTLDWLWLLVPLFGYRILVPSRDLGRARAAALMAVLFLGLAAHLLGLLVTYLRVLQDAALPSFGRYMNGYLAALPIVGAWLLLATRPVRGALARWELGGAWTLLGLAVLLQSPSGSIVFAAPVHLDFREERREQVEAIRRLAPEESRVGIVYRGARQFHFVVLRHDLFPRNCSALISFSTSTRPVETTATDAQRLLLSLEAFQRWVSAHDYIYLARTNDRFWREYRAAFPASAESSGTYLYRVDRLPSGQATLTAVLPAAGGQGSG